MARLEENADEQWLAYRTVEMRGDFRNALQRIQHLNDDVRDALLILQRTNNAKAMEAAARRVQSINDTIAAITTDLKLAKLSRF